MALNKLFPHIEPYSSGYLDVDDTHTLYWEQCGNPDGEPVLFLHGGPGGSITTLSRRYFDPDVYRIILFDQRGCGKSEPAGCLIDNSPQHIVEDIEKLRDLLRVDTWHIFGGSWGSTLALLYALHAPKKCKSLILRGIFLLEEEDVDWFVHGTQYIYPEVWEAFISFLPEDERDDIINGYYKRLTDEDPDIHRPASFAWCRHESSCAMLYPEYKAPASIEEEQDELNLARIEAHFMKHHIIDEENSILNRIDEIRHIPTFIVQGRYDVITPIKTAYKLHRAWPEADYIIVPDGGHASGDPSMRSALIDATETLKKSFR